MISPLLTDLYQLTMAYGYWKQGMHDRMSVFQLIFRNNPFKGNYAIACGLGSVIEFLQNWQFAKDDLNYLSQLHSVDGSALLPQDFLDYLKTLRFTGSVDAMIEGTIVFPQEPLLRITAPLIQGQLLESTLLNLINFQTLIATKATRICHAAEYQDVLEFGLRRAQGPDGAMAASRAAYIGGCAGTSNVLAGKKYGIPVRGTHAHSWVTAFPDELSAFTAYAEVMPHNCILLVDTYDTIQGVKNAIKVGHLLRAKGAELQGIRIDSGDMVALSRKARQLLDDAGFTQTKIIASNSLNEYVIADMKREKSDISVWGVGTHLVTSYDQPALDGVYKLSALQNTQGIWEYKLKLSEQAIKISNPGIYQVKRFLKNHLPVMDILYDTISGISSPPTMISSQPPHVLMSPMDYDASVDLLVPIFVNGQCVYSQPPMHSMRTYCLEQIKPFLQAYPVAGYPVGLDTGLHDLKLKLIQKIKS